MSLARSRAQERRLPSAEPTSAFFGEVSSHMTLINCSLVAAEQLRPVLARQDPER